MTLLDREDEWLEDDDALPVVEVRGEPRREWMVRPVYLGPPTLAVTSRLSAGGYVLSRETETTTMMLHEARQLHDALGEAIALLERLNQPDRDFRTDD